MGGSPALAAMTIASPADRAADGTRNETFGTRAAMAEAIGTVGTLAEGAGAPLNDTALRALRLDSLRFALKRRLLTDEEKKVLGRCARHRDSLLRAWRRAEPGSSDLHRALEEAKRENASPEDPKVLALLERKFALEKKLEDRYGRLPAAKGCREAEAALQKRVEAEVRRHPLYREGGENETTNRLRPRRAG